MSPLIGLTKLPFADTGRKDIIDEAPPRAEHRRIVAKVEQLMTLVDQLETQITASRAAAGNLLEAAVAELTIA